MGNDNKFEKPNKYDFLEPITEEPEFCTVCGTQILAMTWKGSGVCGDNHRKTSGVVIDGEKPTKAKVGINPTGEC